MFKPNAKKIERKTYIIQYDNCGYDDVVAYESIEKPTKYLISKILNVPEFSIYSIEEIGEIRRIS